MVGAQDAGRVFEVLLVQGDRLVKSAGGLVCIGEVVAGGESFGVARSDEAGLVLERLLEQRDCLFESAGGLVCIGEVVA